MTNFILLPGASLLPDVAYVHIVLATSLISLLHPVLDGGPRKWTYEDPSKPMTYQQQWRARKGRKAGKVQRQARKGTKAGTYLTLFLLVPKTPSVQVRRCVHNRTC